VGLKPGDIKLNVASRYCPTTYIRLNICGDSVHLLTHKQSIQITFSLISRCLTCGVEVIFTCSLAGSWNLSLPFGTLTPAVRNRAGEVIRMEIILPLVSGC